MSPSLGLIGATTLSLVLLAPSAAYADHWGSSDPSGDVSGFTYDPDPAPCGTITDLDGSAETNEDITGIGVRHSRRSVVVTAKFRDLTSDSDQTLDVSLRASTGGYDLELDRQDPRSGAWEVFADLATEPIYPDPDDLPDCGSFGVISDVIPCRVGHQISFVHDLIRLTVPRRCVGNPRWVRVGAEADHFVDGGGSFDIYSDEWDNGGKELSPWLPPFGPRVPATDGATIGGGHPHPRAARALRRHVFVRHVFVRHGTEMARR